MSIRAHWPITTIVTLTVLLSNGTATAGSAQTTMPAHDTTHRHQPAKGHMNGMGGMSGMMGPHQVLAMAYRDNLATFARALRGDVTRSQKVNLDVATPAVGEIRRSFDQMQSHHQAHKTAGGDAMKSSMTATVMADMDKHLSALSLHLTALETEVQSSTPSAAKVAEHTSEILKECDGIGRMHAKGMTHPTP